MEGEEKGKEKRGGMGKRPPMNVGWLYVPGWDSLHGATP